MSDIVPKSKAKGVDIVGGSFDFVPGSIKYPHFIVRSDLGCYMRSTDFHTGENLGIYSIHPSCRHGDHYLGEGGWFIFKGDHFRVVNDLATDANAKVYILHPNCRGGDHYMWISSTFYIIFQSRGKLRKTNNLTTDHDGAEFDLHPNCRDGLYYWSSLDSFYLLKPKDKWGVQYHSTTNLTNDADGNTFSVHPDVLNFLPGGLAVTQGPAFGKWELLKHFINDSESTTNWEERITKKVGYTKSKSSSIEHNWNVSMTTSFETGELAKLIAKVQFSLTAEYGGKSINTENENWDEAIEREEKLSLSLEPNKKVYIWQYKIGFGKNDVLFCRDIRIDDEPTPPINVPFPEVKM